MFLNRSFFDDKIRNNVHSVHDDQYDFNIPTKTIEKEQEMENTHNKQPNGGYSMLYDIPGKKEEYENMTDGDEIDDTGSQEANYKNDTVEDKMIGLIIVKENKCYVFQSWLYRYMNRIH